MRPLILAIAHRFPKEEADPAFRFAVSLSVRLMITNLTRTGTVEEGLAETAHGIFSNKTTTAKSLAGSLKAIVPNDEQFRLAFQTATVSNRKLAKYYLRALEMAAKGEAEPWHIPNDDKAIINLEHVLPEKPEGNWPQFSDEQVRLYYRRIGNFVLLRASENSTLKSAPFSEKKNVFAKSPYALTSQVGQASDWTIKEITDRQTGLSDYALRAWK